MQTSGQRDTRWKELEKKAMNSKEIDGSREKGQDVGVSIH